MIQLIVGNKGEGKTKHLLDRVNSQIKTASGNIVFLDKNNKHMHELDNKVRLINVTEYPLQNCAEFIGFLCGVISQDYDLEQMYLDSFLKIAHLEGKDLEGPLKELEKISEQFKVTLVISVSVEEERGPGALRMKRPEGFAVLARKKTCGLFMHGARRADKEEHPWQGSKTNDRER